MEHNYVAIETSVISNKSIDSKYVVDHKYVSNGGSKSKIYQCHVCDSVFKHRASLYKHVKFIHKLTPGGKKCMKCLEKDCDAEFANSNSFRTHLSSVHNIEMLTVELLFKAMSDFDIWKAELESENNVQYVKGTGAHVSKNKNYFIYYYKCNRTGKYRNHANHQPRKRKLKSQGTDKINNHCTSSIVVQEPIDKNSDIKVTYCVSHYGHEIDLRHIRLSNAERSRIAERLKQGETIDTILDEVRNSATTKFEKIHFITRKNILRIAKSYGIDLVKAEENKKERYSRKMKNTQERHVRSTTMPLTAVRELSEDSWIVECEEDYAVSKSEFLEDNHSCFSRCKECEICIHLFSCECPDNILKSELCEHIHLVARYVKEKETIPREEESIDLTLADEDDEMTSVERTTELKDELLLRLQRIMTVVKETDDKETLDALLEHVMAFEDSIRNDKENVRVEKNEIRLGEPSSKKIAFLNPKTTNLSCFSRDLSDLQFGY